LFFHNGQRRIKRAKDEKIAAENSLLRKVEREKLNFSNAPHLYNILSSTHAKQLQIDFSFVSMNNYFNSVNL
jgi:hypothetical protein